MGEKDTKIKPLFMTDPEGQKYELGGIQEINGEILIHSDSDEYLENASISGSFTSEINIENLKHVSRMLGGLFVKAYQKNNWKKLHGLPMRRKTNRRN
nr:MAG TPA: hypothetical protein [Bacteriophage sp.]